MAGHSKWANIKHRKWAQNAPVYPFAENPICPLAVRSKNYLYAGSHEAAQRAAMVYSLFASCKANELNPYVWLKEVLEVIPDHKANRLHELLPSSPRFKP